jgi:hypothetical protein
MATPSTRGDCAELKRQLASILEKPLRPFMRDSQPFDPSRQQAKLAGIS